MNIERRINATEQRQHSHAKGELVLELIKAPADRRALNEALDPAGWKLEARDSLAAAQPMLPSASVVLCDEELSDGNWRDVLTRIEGLPVAPALVVASHLADEHLWVEVLNRGAYDLLLEPFRAEEVVRTVEGACGSLSRAQNREKR